MTNVATSAADRRARSMINARQQTDFANLSRANSGAAEQALLTAHLDGCPPCCDVVGRLAGESPIYPRIADVSPAAESALLRVVERIKGESPTTRLGSHSTDGGEPVSLDFLAPADDRSQLGRLGRYAVLEEIGRGASGIVLKALDEKLGRIVALKVLSPRLATNEHARRRFVREAKAAAAIRDDQVIGIYHVEEVDGLPFLVMEYIVGRSLQQRLDADGPLPVTDILRIGGQIARGLAAAHAQGLVHRDIKPANILLENGVERVKITDFGLAHAVDDVRTTQPGVVIGTPEFMSPEQARGERVDHRCDLFSLGCVLYAMCAGRPPFRAESTMAILRRVCEDTPRPLAEINPEIPAWLADIIDQLMAKYAAERFQSATEVAELLGQCLAHVQQRGVGVPPAMPGGRGSRRAEPYPRQGSAGASPSQSRRQWTIAAAIVLLLAAALGMAESTGVTHVAATVIRIVRGDGTLVVEVDDPNIQVLIDGEELVITGAGPKEIRLRPGQHELTSVKDGTPVETKLVTITQGGRDVVKVSRQQATPSGTITRQVWINAPSSTGCVSPDGHAFAFTNQDTGDLAIRDLTTGAVHNVTSGADWTNGSVYAENPMFSHDGEKVAYSWYSKEGDYELRVVSRDGGEPQIIYRDKNTFPEAYGWMPDDDRLLITLHLDEKVELALASLKGGGIKNIKTFERHGAGVGPHRLSPDGKYVALSRVASRGANRDLYLVDIDSGKETRLTSNPADENAVAWTPDGQRLIFISNRHGVRHLWLMSLTGGKPTGDPTLLRRDVGEITAHGMTRAGALYYRATTEAPGIFVGTMNLEDGTATATPLAAEKLSGGDEFFLPEWSPDGKELAYKVVSRGVHANAPGTELRIATLETGDSRVLKPPFYYLATFRWSPDSRSLLTVAYKDPATIGIHQVDIDSAKATTIIETPGEGKFGGIRWSRDGKGIYYQKTGDGIFFRELATQTEQKLYGPAWFAPSPDERQMAILDSEIKILNRDDGSERVLARLIPGQRGAWVNWTADGKYLLYLKTFCPEGQLGLWFVSTHGGEPRKLKISGLDSQRHQTMYALHPDGKQFAITTPGLQKSDLWALENFLPPLDDSKPVAATASAASKSDLAQYKTDRSGPVVRRVWDKAPKTSLLGGISPAGKFLAFGEAKEFGPQLAIRELETGITRRIGELGGVYPPAGIFSPDGKQMSYRWRNEQRIGDFDDRPSRTLAAADESKVTAASLPQWSYDGKQILEALYYPARRAIDITLISVPDGSTRVLKSIDHYADRLLTVAMPRGGDHVAYSLSPTSQTSNRDIFLVSTDGKGHTSCLIEHPADDFVIGWTPNDQRLLFASDRMGSMGIWSIRVEDGKALGSPELIKGQIGPFSPIGLTKDGAFFYAVGLGQADVLIATLDPQTGKLVGSPSVGIRRYEGNNSTPAWSPDGRYLVCRSSLAGPSDLSRGAALLCIRDMQTDAIRVLEPKLQRLDNWLMCWSPDGRSLLATGTDLQSRQGLFRIDVQTGDVTLLAETDAKTGERVMAPDWSPDGKSVYFVRDAAGAIGSKNPRRIVRRDLSTGQEVELRQVPGYIFWMPISPFGNELAFVVGGSLQVLPVTGGEPRTLAQADASCGIAWTPDGRFLFFGRKSGEGRTELWRIAATGGDPQSTGLMLNTTSGISWLPDIRMHPDGKQIAFANRQEDISEIWALENFLPPQGPAP